MPLGIFVSADRQIAYTQTFMSRNHSPLPVSSQPCIQLDFIPLSLPYA